MTKRKSDKKHDAVAGDAELGRSYRGASTELPSPALDTEILAAARRAVQTPPAHQRFAKRWAVPLSVAAVVVLSVGVVLRVTQEGVLPETTSVPAPVTAPAASQEYTALEKSQSNVPNAPVRQAPAPAAKVMRERAEARRDTHALQDSAPLASQSAPAEVDRMARARGESAAVGTMAKQESRAVPERANVVSVQVRGQPGAYEFEVGIKSPDTGCQQYADWWEVLSLDGTLIYRRVLGHSHADEQPFRRRGGPVPIAADTVVWVRAHMNTSGYGGVAYKGSPRGGFTAAPLSPEFAAVLATQAPLPDSCAF